MPIQTPPMNTAGAPSSAIDTFLDVKAARAGAIKGESTAAGHVDEIRLTKWRWGVAASSAVGSAAATARRQYRALVVEKTPDNSSTGLLSALVNNDELKEINLSMRKIGGQALDYFQMKLGGGRVVDIDLDVDLAGLPVERVTFHYTRIEVTYRSQLADGTGGAACSFSDDVTGTQ